MTETAIPKLLPCPVCGADRSALTSAESASRGKPLTSSGSAGTHGDMATRYITVSDFPSHYPWPSKGALRQLINRGDENGFNSVVRRVAGRVLIDEQAFHRWIAERDAESRAAAG